MKDQKIDNSITLEAGSFAGTQSTLTGTGPNAVITLTPHQKQELDESFALALFMSNSPFNFVENPYVVRFLKKMNSAYDASSRTTFSTKLLDIVYAKTLREVQEKIEKLDSFGLNIITDESSDINRNRILSMSVNGKQLTFFHKAEDMRDQNLNAQNYAAWILREMVELTNGNF
jgi:hypothetical protein